MTPTPETLETFDCPQCGQDLRLPPDAYERFVVSEQARQRAETVAKTVALAIGDRTHGAMASECNEWRRMLEAALASDETKTKETK